MGTDDETVYLLSGGHDDSDEWVSPTPAIDAIRTTLIAETDLDADDLDDLPDAVEAADLAGGLEAEEAVTIDVADHTVTVDGDGGVSVE